jgi:hypothetical protein
LVQILAEFTLPVKGESSLFSRLGKNLHARKRALGYEVGDSRSQGNLSKETVNQGCIFPKRRDYSLKKQWPVGGLQEQKTR